MRDIKRKKDENRKMAKERIETLFLQAEKSDDPSLKRRYVTLARKLGMKFKVRIPRELKRRFCRHCGTYFVPGKNLRVRTKNQKVVYYCLECKKHMRFPYVREIKAKRKKTA